MASRKNVSAAAVVAWALDNMDSIPAEGHVSVTGSTDKGRRGNLHPVVIEAFRKANKGLTYERASEAERKHVTVEYAALDALGRKRTAKATLTNAAARLVLGQPTDRKGRLPLKTLSLAVEAFVLAGEPLPEA